MAVISSPGCAESEIEGCLDNSVRANSSKGSIRVSAEDIVGDLATGIESEGEVAAVNASEGTESEGEVFTGDDKGVLSAGQRIDSCT